MFLHGYQYLDHSGDFRKVTCIMFQTCRRNVLLWEHKGQERSLVKSFHQLTAQFKIHYKPVYTNGICTVTSYPVWPNLTVRNLIPKIYCDPMIYVSSDLFMLIHFSKNNIWSQNITLSRMKPNSYLKQKKIAINRWRWFAKLSNFLK